VLVDLSDLPMEVLLAEEAPSDVVVARVGENARPVEANNPNVRTGNFIVGGVSQ
jgi:hypothetical protein